MNIKLRTALLSFVCLLVSVPAFSFQAAEEQASSDSDIERITVYGTKTLNQLKKEIRKTTKAFFKDYNKLNKNNQYAVICKRESRSGSGMKSTTCEPRFVKTKRSDMIATQVFGNDASALAGVEFGSEFGNSGTTTALAFSRLTMISGAGRIASSKNKKFNEHVLKLMQENPQLVEKYNEIIELQAEFDYKKANN